MDLPSRLLCLLLVAAMGAPSGLAHAEVFKWIDDKGVVNYGDQPPGGGKNAVPLDASTSTLSVVPGLSQDVLQREHQRNLEAHIAQLEQELYDQRVRAALSPAALVSDTSESALATRLYGYPSFYPIMPARTVLPHRPRVRDPRHELLPTLVRPPEHR